MIMITELRLELCFSDAFQIGHQLIKYSGFTKSKLILKYFKISKSISKLFC
jgi:hypothetical protein